MFCARSITATGPLPDSARAIHRCADEQLANHREDKTPPANENYVTRDIEAAAKTGEAKTGTLAGTSSKKTGTSEESVAETKKKTA